MPSFAERCRTNRAQFTQVDKRNWQLWMISFSITLILALAIAAFFYPALRWHVGQIQVLRGYLPQLLTGLITLVVLCIAYIIHKQRELNELRAFLVAIHLEARRLNEEYPKDPLTGALDRRALPDILKREVTWVDRYRVPLTLALFNIVEFQRINALEGNLAGDEVLKRLARTLENTARQTDTIMRYGPDRFLCFLPRTDLVGAEAFGTRVNTARQNDNRLRKLELTFGVGLYEANGDPQAALATAESKPKHYPRLELVPAVPSHP